jgi:hypothetical protein
LIRRQDVTVRRLEERLRQVRALPPVASGAASPRQRRCLKRSACPLFAPRLIIRRAHRADQRLCWQVELSSEEKVTAAKEQGRAQAASEMKAVQEELQRLQLRRNADAEAARKVLAART